jgi:hypothetical protein
MACITKQLFAFAQYDGIDEKVEPVDEVRLEKQWIERRTAPQHYVRAFARRYLFQLVEAAQLVAVDPIQLLIAWVSTYLFALLKAAPTGLSAGAWGQ